MNNMHTYMTYIGLLIYTYAYNTYTHAVVVIHTYAYNTYTHAVVVIHTYAYNTYTHAVVVIKIWFITLHTLMIINIKAVSTVNYCSDYFPTTLIGIFKTEKWKSWLLHSYMCRRSGLVVHTSYGGGTGPIWLDDVRCTGNERSLAECPHRGWNVHKNCRHADDVSIMCGNR